MTPGQFARRLLGRHFKVVGNLYRRVFVDLGRIVDFYAQELPVGAKILDVGGGDGALIDRLLDRRPDLNVTMCDLAPAIGSFLSERHRAAVTLLPATDLAAVTGSFDAVTVSDVVHHVPVDQRDQFFTSLMESCDRWNCRKIILKDIEPGTWRATLSLLADRYITGDRHVVLFSRAALGEFVRRHLPNVNRRSVTVDRPNYCEALSW